MTVASSSSIVEMALKGIAGLRHAHESDHDYRCPECHRLLFRGVLGRGTDIETMCPRKTCSGYREHRKIWIRVP